MYNGKHEFIRFRWWYFKYHWWLYQKDNHDRISNEKLKQDILEYVDTKMKIERKKQEKQKNQF